MINIPSYIEDPSYRYKMPKLQTRIEGRGNGIKTALPNMFEVARYLKVPTEYPTKWFGCELGASSMISEDRAIVNGAHTQETMQESLDRFIDKYVLCPKCKLPEITMEITKKKFIEAKCSACGWDGKLDSVHKLATYITNHPDLLKNPKTANTQDIAASSSKKNSTVSVTAAPSVAAPASDLLPTTADKKKKKKETSEAAVTAVELEPLTVEENFDTIYAEVIKPVSAETQDNWVSELKRRQASLGFGNSVKLFCALSLLFAAERETEKVLTGKLVTEQIAFLRKLVPKSTTEETCRAFELFFWKNPEVSMRDFPMILKALFDEDWVSEKSLLKRYDSSKTSDKPGVAEAKKRAQPFVEWLKTEDSEDSESLDDDE